MSGADAGSFREIAIEPYYRSGERDVVKSFFIPILACATSYNRAVGYFTSASMTLLAMGLDDFEQRESQMRIVASPHLLSEDIEAIENGYDVRSVLERATLRSIEGETRDSLLDGLSVIGRLIAKGLLDVKLAFMDDANSFGLYHEKIGYFGDETGDIVAFTGSANETYGGMVANFESIEVYRGWVSEDTKRAVRVKHSFDDLWSGSTPRLAVIDFPDAAKDRLVSMSRARPASSVPPEGDPVAATVGESLGSGLRIPPGFDVRNYQKTAVEAWLRGHGRGVLKMATGTGKTKTALVAASKVASVLKEREQPFVLVIAAPYQHLIDQWIDEVAFFGVDAVGIYESSTKWHSKVQQQLTSLRLGQRPIVVLVTTNDSLKLDRFQQILGDLHCAVMFIGDEAHNLGSSGRVKSLPEGAIYRLGLSATPERWFDDRGTQALFDYFGPVVFELGLGEAIEMGALCRYIYTPRVVELSQEETALYVSITNQIAPLLSTADSADVDDDSALGQLLRKRSGVLGHAVNKLKLLGSDLSLRESEWFQLVYCAEGRRPLEVGYSDDPSQLTEVLRLAGNELGLSVQKYVSETPRVERRRLLERFGSGDDLRVLASMRCLDEGVDIPDARVAYLLASSSNPRQFIQRRGRILRPAPGKERAEIIDYVVVPGQGAVVNFGVERKLLGRELARINEFGRLSENYGETLEVLRPFKQQYQLMDL